MHTNRSIQYLTHQQINKEKWDACIDMANHSLIYNRSWYLDAMAERWDALVLNDYETVMPLIWRKKYGIRYLYQPFFTAQVGITGNNISTALTDAFLKAIPSHFKFTDIDLDENNTTQEFALQCRTRVNMLLDTNKDYPELYKQYHRLATRMIKRSSEESLHIEEDAGINESIAFYQRHYQSQVKIPPAVYKKLAAMLQAASLNNHVISLTACKGQHLQGMYILLKDKKYVYSVIGGSSAEGKQKAAFLWHDR